MAAPTRRWAAELLYFWFHRLKPSDWFGGSDTLDAVLAWRFGRELATLSVRPADEFAQDPHTALAAILLFDQIARNIYRGRAQAFATDPQARAVAKALIARGWVERCPLSARAFVLMPLMHSEAIVDQQLSVALFARHAPANLAYARAHYRMIARFGRFPHRNAILGRSSTPAEEAAVAAGYSW